MTAPPRSVGRPLALPPDPWRFPEPAFDQRLNRLRVLGYRLPGQPLVTAVLAVDTPPSAEARRHWGIGWLTARALGTGAGGRDARQIEQDLELLGASLQTSATRAGLVLKLTVPGRRLRPALGLLADILLRPELSAPEIDQLIRLRLDEIRQQRANPRTRAQLEFSEACFTADSRQSCPVAGTSETVGAVTAGAVELFYRQRVSRAPVTLVLAGELDQIAPELLVDEFGRGRAGDCDGSTTGGAAGGSIEPAAPRRQAAARIVLVDVPGAAQTQVMLGTGGTDRLDPDWAALNVAAYVLGGTVDSRLNRVLREQRGFTYGMRAAFDACRRGGTFTVSGAFHTGDTVAALAETMQLLHGYASTGPKQAERDAAVDFFARTAPLAYQTAQSVASRAADLLSHDLQLDFVDRNRQAVIALSASEITEAFQRKVSPALTIALVGDAARIAEPLQQAGFDGIECRSQ